MEFFFTRAGLLLENIDSDIIGAPFEEVWRGELREVCRKTFVAIGVDDRAPFILRSDLSYDRVGSELFRTQAGQVTGRTTMEGYGRHGFRFLRWIAGRSGGLRAVDVRSVAAYRKQRLAQGVTPRAWNTEAAAVKSLLDAAVVTGTISSNPCAHPNLAWYHHGAEAAPKAPNFVTLAQFKRFRDGGLGTGVYGLRNIAFANMLLTSGMRIAEGNHYPEALLCEAVIARTPGRRSVPHLVPASVAKGGKLRKTIISRAAVDSMLQYRDILRPDLVERARRAGRMPEDEGPPELWLSQSGLPMTDNAWEWLFRKASAATGIKATPHTLRHTFAVYVLSRLISLTIGSLADAKKEAKRVVAAPHTIYDSLFGDPLRKVQKLLGHERYDTTFIYLDALGNDDLVTDEALAVFDEVMDAEEDYAGVDF